MESGAWADLPAELLSIISDRLQERIDFIRFHGVCRSWRYSAINIQNNNQVISPLFPRTLSYSSLTVCNFFQCNSRPHYVNVIANAIYHLRSKKANWIVSVKESKPGILLLRDALTYERIPYSSVCRLDMSGWSVTTISLSHTCSFSTPKCNCYRWFVDTKVVLVDDESESMAIFKRYGNLCALRRGELITIVSRVYDFVSFNGCIYAVDVEAVVYLLDPKSFQLLQLINCANLPQKRCAMSTTGKRFVVSDGDLYIVFNYRAINTIYKLVMDDGVNPTRLEEVKDLGDRVFFISKYSSFSVSARDLPPPLVGNCVLVTKDAFPYCSFSSDFRMYHLGGNPTRILRHVYRALFMPPLLWTRQLQRPVVSKTKSGRARRGVVSNMININPPTS